ncbi:MAG: ThiF family adenylyltransferase [Deltaproteobacteria bacterium]|nr:ThiF family adenylyltransferase [Deltaproteobacteria bacterium]
MHFFHKSLVIEKMQGSCQNACQDILITHGAKAYQLKTRHPHMDEAIDKLKRGTAQKELSQLIGQKNAESLWQILDEKKFIRTKFVNYFENTAYEKQVQYFSEFVSDPNQSQERLLKSFVVIVGCGGTGNIIARLLAACGVRRFVLIDPEFIEVSNLNRQICFTQCDVGKPKAEVLKTVLENVVLNSEITAIQTRIDTGQTLPEILHAFPRPDLIVCAADTPPVDIQMWIARMTLEFAIPTIFGGVGMFSGTLGPLLSTRESANKFYLLCKKIKENKLNFNSVLSPSICFTNNAIANMIAEDAAWFLSNIKVPRTLECMLSVDTNTNEIKIISHFAKAKEIL